MNEKDSILIVDDDEVTLRLIALVLGKKGYETVTSETGQEAIKRAEERFFNVAILDIMLPDVEGIELITPLKEMHPDMEVIVITAFASMENAVRALNEGASAYITKPLNMDEVLATIREALEKQHLTIENRRLYQEAQRELAERKRTEVALRESERKYRTLVDNIQQRIYHKDRNSVYVSCNVSYAQDLQITPDEIAGKTDFDFLPKEQAEKSRAIDKRIMESGNREEREEKYLKDDREFWVHTVKTPIKDETGNVIGVLGIFWDITERKQAEQKKIELEKRGALGTLTAGIAHELNNPMMGMLNFIEYCLKKTSRDDKRYPVLLDAERETERCIDIVRNLLTFSRIEREDEERFKKDSIPKIFERVFNLLSYRIDKENILLTQEYSEETPEIWVKVSNIQQVFLNLVGNAMDAIKGSKKKEINVTIRPDGQFVLVTIADSGCGISPEDLQNIFDPFFTTKPAGQGTGLGLSVCHSIVKAHGGEITCESEIGIGTRFNISLPIERRSKIEY